MGVPITMAACVARVLHTSSFTPARTLRYASCNLAAPPALPDDADAAHRVGLRALALIHVHHSLDARCFGWLTFFLREAQEKGEAPVRAILEVDDAGSRRGTWQSLQSRTSSVLGYSTMRSTGYRRALLYK